MLIIIHQHARLRFVYLKYIHNPKKESGCTSRDLWDTVVGQLDWKLWWWKRERERSLRVYYYRTHLYSSLREINLHGQIFPREDVRIVSLRERGLEFLQLLEGESCPVSALLPAHEGILADSVQCWVIGGVTSICNEIEKYCLFRAFVKYCFCNSQLLICANFIFHARIQKHSLCR